MDKRWYVLHTYSGFEYKVKFSLEEKIKSLSREEQFGEIIVPTETVIELVKGQKKVTSRKFFPGYVLINMDLNDETWHVVRSVPKVTGFVGGMDPPPISDEEVAKITRQIAEGKLKPKPKVQMEVGENVRVIEGPFTNFSGVVDEVKPERGKVKVLVSIFGRSTPVELDFLQVERA